MLIKPPAPFLMNPTSSTPFVEFDSKVGKLDIIGKRAPKSNSDFYDLISTQIENYLSNSGDTLNVNISFEDSEINSNEDFKQFLLKMKAFDKDQNEILLNWYYYEFEENTKSSLESQIDDLGMKYTLRSYTE